MSTTSPDLFIDLDRSRPRGLRAQVEDGLRSAIRSGRLAPGTRLPSSRALAADLDVTRGVVVDAYEQLAAEGYVSSVQGSGTVVNDIRRHRRPSTSTAARARDRGPAAPRIDFRTGLPDLEPVPAGRVGARHPGGARVDARRRARLRPAGGAARACGRPWPTTSAGCGAWRARPTR